MSWTRQALEYEWRYVYQERLGILCGDKKPTERQEQIARSEANDHFDLLTGYRR